MYSTHVCIQYKFTFFPSKISIIINNNLIMIKKIERKRSKRLTPYMFDWMKCNGEWTRQNMNDLGGQQCVYMNILRERHNEHDYSGICIRKKYEMMIYNFLRCGVNDDERWQWLLKNIRILRTDMNELIVVIFEFIIRSFSK